MPEFTTPFEREWGIPPERVGISRPTNRDLAVEARLGGRLIILAIELNAAALKAEAETCNECGQLLAEGEHNEPED